VASKRRIRRKQCSKKNRFDTRELAHAAMHRLLRSGSKHGGWLHVYPCRFCNGYHFGHASSTRS
jgi:hypothetical protein